MFHDGFLVGDATRDIARSKSMACVMVLNIQIAYALKTLCFIWYFNMHEDEASQNVKTNVGSKSETIAFVRVLSV